jgi:hypothetical protein
MVMRVVAIIQVVPVGVLGMVETVLPPADAVLVLVGALEARLMGLIGPEQVVVDTLYIQTHCFNI